MRDNRDLKLENGINSSTEAVFSTLYINSVCLSSDPLTWLHHGPSCAIWNQFLRSWKSNFPICLNRSWRPLKGKPWVPAECLSSLITVKQRRESGAWMGSSKSNEDVAALCCHQMLKQKKRRKMQEFLEKCNYLSNWIPDPLMIISATTSLPFLENFSCCLVTARARNQIYHRAMRRDWLRGIVSEQNQKNDFYSYERLSWRRELLTCSQRV